MDAKIQITEKLKSDFQATIDFWDAASYPKNNIFSKDDWKKKETIEHLLNNCAFCEYFLDYDSCLKCPLYNFKLCDADTNGENQEYENYVYFKWHGTSAIKEKAEYAKIISDFISNWCDKNIFNNQTGYIEL